MITTHPALSAYVVDVVELKGASNRVDWTVSAAPAVTPADAPDFVAALRRFFADFVDEVARHKHDPIATGQALAKVEAINADLRYLINLLRSTTATAMDDYRVRRIVVEGVGVWEASSTIEKSEWQHERLVTDYLTARGVLKAITDDGELVPVEYVAGLVGLLYGPSTAPRVTPLKEAGLRPDDYCTMKVDEDGRAVRTPTVSVRVNEVRK